MNKSCRIQLEDTPISAMIKMVEGNPGAIRVCAELFEQSSKIDPDAALEGMVPIFTLDTHGIYGSRIWMLYKDVCKGNLTKVIAVLRAVQLGLISERTLLHAIDNYGEGLDINDAHRRVKEKLPKFADFEEVK